MKKARSQFNRMSGLPNDALARSNEFIVQGFEIISDSLDENYDYVCSESRDVADLLMSYLVGFIEHAHNIESAKKAIRA
jgi:hypothetical protein